MIRVVIITIAMLILIFISCSKNQQIKQLEENMKNTTESLKTDLQSEESMKNDFDSLRFEYGKIVNVSFRIRNSTERHSDKDDVISVIRMAEGASAEFSNKFQKQVVELDEEEWLDFINKLYICRVDKWQKGYYEGSEAGTNKWILRIDFSDKERFVITNLSYLQNWEKFIETMDGIKVKIKNQQIGQLDELEGLKTEYKKRFGNSITDFELSIVNVSFSIGNPGKPRRSFSMTRTANGVIAEYNEYKTQVVKLDIGEWFDFIHALYECHIDKWEEWKKMKVEEREKAYSKSSDMGDLLGSLGGETWAVEIFFVDKEKFKVSSTNEYPQNWTRFLKIMNDMETKIKEGKPK